MARTREVARRGYNEFHPRKTVAPARRGRQPKRPRPIVVTVASSDSDSDSEDEEYSSQVNTNNSDDSTQDESDDEAQQFPSSSAATASGAALTVSDPGVLNCPICIHPLTISVYQCEDGHFSCQSCYDKIEDKCPTCNKSFGNKRCRGMEKVLESIRTPCKNMEHGCMKKISFSKKIDHENSCKYAPISCPCVGCKYVGVGKRFYDHYAENHPDSWKLIMFDKVSSINVGEEQYLLFEEKENILFFLNHIIDPLGSFVCVSTAPTASNMKFSYDLTAGSSEMSVNMKSFVEITPKCFAKPAKEKCLLISPNIHSGAKHRGSMLPLQLVIQKVSIEQTAK